MKLLTIYSFGLLVLSPLVCFSQTTSPQPQKKVMPPIIDIHVHSTKVGTTPRPDPCLWFLQDMPGTDPKTGMAFSLSGNCVDPIKASTSDAELKAAFIETINRLNITAVTFGDAGVLLKNKNAIFSIIILPAFLGLMN